LGEGAGRFFARHKVVNVLAVEVASSYTVVISVVEGSGTISNRYFKHLYCQWRFCSFLPGHICNSLVSTNLCHCSQFGIQVVEKVQNSGFGFICSYYWHQKYDELTVCEQSEGSGVSEW